MKSLLQNPIVSSILGVLIWAYMVLCAWTIRWTIEGEDTFRNAWSADHGLIVAAWHSRILLIPSIWSRIARKLEKKTYGTAMLVSLSRDGEAVAKGINHLGIESVRGSSTHKRKKKDKGGIAALAEASRRLRANSVLCITPDGPRGPAETVQPGPILLAQRTGAAIIPYAVNCRPVKRLDTWDRFMIPIPFARGAMVMGEPVFLDKTESMEAATAKLSDAMEAVYARASAILSRKD